jgi:16S rRNA (adenine1518-N6/adenine1519-N6)-dimethyltransferase
MGAIDDLPPLREVIAAHGIAAKKALGQNFLLDLNLTAKIARAAGDLSGHPTGGWPCSRSGAPTPAS